MAINGTAKEAVTATITATPTATLATKGTATEAVTATVTISTTTTTKQLNFVYGTNINRFLAILAIMLPGTCWLDPLGLA